MTDTNPETEISVDREYRHPSTALFVAVVVLATFPAVALTRAGNNGLAGLPWWGTVLGGLAIMFALLVMIVLSGIGRPRGRIGTFIRLYAMSIVLGALLPDPGGDPGLIARMLGMNISAVICMAWAFAFGQPRPRWRWPGWRHYMDRGVAAAGMAAQFAPFVIDEIRTARRAKANRRTGSIG